MRKPLFPMTKAAVTVCSEITSPTSKGIHRDEKFETSWYPAVLLSS
jgi:hypothetical protein